METNMVLESARRHLDKLAPLAKQSPTRPVKEFTEELKTIEAELAKLALGIQVEVAIDYLALEQQLAARFRRRFWTTRAMPTTSKARLFIAYARHGTRWRIMVRTYRQELEDTGKRRRMTWSPVFFDSSISSRWSKDHGSCAWQPRVGSTRCWRRSTRRRRASWRR